MSSRNAHGNARRSARLGAGRGCRTKGSLAPRPRGRREIRDHANSRTSTPGCGETRRFFFFQTGGSYSGKREDAVRNIAYQLALSVPSLRSGISQIVEDDPSIVQRTIETQMLKLISEPCRSHRNDDHVTVFVDGLDECEHHGVQQEILRAIRIASSQSPVFLRFIVASRPEPHIREVFDSPGYSDIHRSFNVEQSFDDVRKYLCDEFARIHREHRSMTHIPLPWPSPDIVQKLVLKSSGYFIYASTTIKFIDDKSHRPAQRLALVLSRNSTGSESPFAALDQLYITVLSSAPRQDEFMPILCLFVEDGCAAISTIEELLGLETGETELLLHGLYSLIECCENEIAVHHASFLDFLKEASRSQKFHVGSVQNRMRLAHRFLHSTSGDYGTMYFGYEPSAAQRELIPRIISLPPSMEFCRPINRMNPERIFNLKSSDLESMLSWLKVRSAHIDHGTSDFLSENTVRSRWFGQTLGGLCVHVLLPRVLGRCSS
ncbi:hypothetical protein C8R45DRAFT_297697 [Mycena sanguinolenta]|nr:hypothetical protein C8R45DRAFT_297697 [Mycena sanguinolenta]